MNMLRQTARCNRANCIRAHAGKGSRVCHLAWTGVTLAMLALAAPRIHAQPAPRPPAKTKEVPVAVRFTDISKAAGITFLQDSTQTDQK